MSKNYTIVAFEFPPYKGGIANYSYALARYLVCLDREVRVYTINPKAQEAGYFLYRPYWHYNPSAFPWLIRKVISFFYRQYQLAFCQRMIRNIKKEYDVQNREIIITTLFFDLSRNLIKELIAEKVAYSIVLHGLDIHELLENDPKFFNAAVANAQRIVFNSEYTKQLLQEKQRNDYESLVIPPMLDISGIQDRPLMTRRAVVDRFKIPNNARWILSVCRLVPRKGIDRALESIVKLMESHEDVIYLVAGKGAEEENLQSMIPERFIKRILFLGAVTEHEKFGLLHHSKIFIMPNREIEKDVEGFGISFIEATLMKNWVIGGNSGGVPEAVRTDLNGYLIDENMTSDQLAQLISEVLKRVDKGELQQAKEYVSETFDLRTTKHGL